MVLAVALTDYDYKKCGQYSSCVKVMCVKTSLKPVFPINEGDVWFGPATVSYGEKTKICQSIRPFHSCTFLPPVTKREEEVTLTDVTFFLMHGATHIPATLEGAGRLTLR